MSQAMWSSGIVIAVAVATAVVLDSANAFVGPFGGEGITFVGERSSRRTRSSRLDLAPVDPGNVVVCKDERGIRQSLRYILSQDPCEAYLEREMSSIAISDGPILNVMGGTVCGVKTLVAYVNHKCVPKTDKELSTHAKARKKFLLDWPFCKKLVVNGTSDAVAEANLYDDKMKRLAPRAVPRRVDEDGLPMFDLLFLDVADDGSIGELRPNQPEISNYDTDRWVLPVTVDDPPSITFSLPVMLSAKKIVAVCYGEDKAQLMKRVLTDETEKPETCPAIALRVKGDEVIWILDQQAASALGPDYASCKDTVIPVRELYL